MSLQINDVTTRGMPIGTTVSSFKTKKKPSQRHLCDRGETNL